MATPTYDLLDSVTVSTPVTEVTFTSIGSSYRDLVLVGADILGSSGSGTIGVWASINSDTGTNYNAVWMRGDGTTPNSLSDANNDKFAPLVRYNPSETSAGQFIAHFLDYSATDKHKSILVRSNTLSTGGVAAGALRWASNSAITSITIYNSNYGFDFFATGSTFYLYGVAA